MRLRDRLRGLIFKYRGLVWGLFAVAILIFPVSFSPVRIYSALPLLVAGQSLRFWAAGFIPKYRTLVVDAPCLVTGGPYAWMRNPLYAGNGIMGLGWALMAGRIWTVVFAVIYFALYSLTIIPSEEKFLMERFGDEYTLYKKTTPSLFPALWDVKSRIERSAGFEAKKSWFMECHSLRMNALVTVVVLGRLYFSG
ncbi:MAG: isoprenylcysteine carboxylmethyltransferase family protein [Synergistaceae bacterium]|nr:isoprenylcysteine carboxylmethyltransferase family protein [Synergistaceae bacterium]